MTTKEIALARLADLLSTWVDGERREYCLMWAAYHRGNGEKPGKPGDGVPRKDSDFYVYSEALACVRFGWASKAHLHEERIERCMRRTPKLEKFPLAVRVGVPQPWDGKE